MPTLEISVQMFDGAVLTGTDETELARQVAAHAHGEAWTHMGRPQRAAEVDDMLHSLREATGEGRVWLRLSECGHFGVRRGCGGCDPGAIDMVLFDAAPGVRRACDPSADMTDQGA